ncbi:bifunctional 2-polyprenyl-6-hydroxyphenol methylase/3-demethylubiquinol 3-O-methyltransferase UbiG [Desulfosporosinus sp.]|uniref:class I SAM-dependent methyltransferase n=1 Tax=Desulfosporosinus sp. TaxID=157907 RepID=UPI000E8ADCA2|nr:class I SAM-dependent methyltransferase [Desulfosporosinus sp.]MBC2722975.1 class I SAM-dependent methyltransferase [Desulfosporosinus sp.]MBC2727285.1 class I SAM-dependent methyltransferase [Desulfosporosinus sp.]HBV86532.1 class I SAM-dependent methyltransferase [Desulfosporosinus sp.]
MNEALFDPVAAHYDSWYDTELGSVSDQVERHLAQSMFKAPGLKVLEIGCGTGQYTSWLVQEGYQVTAVDISSEMMGLAKKKLSIVENNLRAMPVHWWHADITKILDQLEFYDGIFSMTAFEFVPEPENVLKKLFNHLKPGGCLMIGLIAGMSSWSEYYAEAARNNPTSVFARAALYTKEEIYSWKIGVSVEIGECLFFPPNVQTTSEALSIEEKREGNPGFLVAKWVKG